MRKIILLPLLACILGITFGVPRPFAQVNPDDPTFIDPNSADVCKTRRSWNTLTTEEQEAFGVACASLYQDSQYLDFIEEHADVIRHNTEFFLPDHRDFLARVEDALSRHGWEDGLPYYDATVGELVDEEVQWQLFDDDSLWNILGGGEENANNCLNAPFDVPVVPASSDSDERQCVTRTFDREHTLIDTATITRIVVGITDQDEFSDSINGGQHSLVHLAVGGSMRRVRTSAADPFFYLHHAYVDMLWASWERLHAEVEEGPTNWNEYCYHYDAYYGQTPTEAATAPEPTTIVDSVDAAETESPTADILEAGWGSQTTIADPEVSDLDTAEEEAVQVLEIEPEAEEKGEVVVEELEENPPTRFEVARLGVSPKIVEFARGVAKRAHQMRQTDDEFAEDRLIATVTRKAIEVPKPEAIVVHNV